MAEGGKQQFLGRSAFVASFCRFLLLANSLSLNLFFKFHGKNNRKQQKKAKSRFFWWPNLSPLWPRRGRARPEADFRPLNHIRGMARPNIVGRFGYLFSWGNPCFAAYKQQPENQRRKVFAPRTMYHALRANKSPLWRAKGKEPPCGRCIKKAPRKAGLWWAGEAVVFRMRPSSC